MPVVIPFDACIARPDDGRRSFPLREHLEAVAAACGRAESEPHERLGFLAGLLHDAAKAHADWQDYIRGRGKEGPPHAPLGAALFAYCAGKLIGSWRPDRVARRVLGDAVLDWTRAVYDHHGELGDLDEKSPPWEVTGADRHFREDIDRCDLDGVFTLVDTYLPGGGFSRGGFLEWLAGFPGWWERAVRLEREKLLKARLALASSEELIRARQALSIPRRATCLVVGDRYHAGGLRQRSMDGTEAERGNRCLLEECRLKARKAIAEGADPVLVEHRQLIQQQVLDTYLRHPQEAFYTLLLPTGYGKTLSALRVALTACANGPCRRIIYVAPYLSILSQNTAEISTTTRIEAMQHHHLSLAELDDDQVEATETWQAPILTTTFNQLFRAVFPRRAHQCLRREALRNSFIVIDEAQIIDTAVWNVFLRVLSAMAAELSFQVLFTTATLPPLEEGSQRPALPLAPQVELPERFEILYSPEPLEAASVAARAVDAVEEVGSAAVVMNTVRDAVQVYELAKACTTEETHLCCLTGLMLPSHKSRTIREVREALKTGRRVLAVCTQILEAGVDLSFRKILRALPILPSMVQVAGRANRHGEGTRAQVIVFPFVREDGQDTRKWVYRDATACHQTDRILAERPCWLEGESVERLDTYYEACWDENRNTSCLEKIKKASYGCWSELAGIAPFGAGPPRESLFVDQPVENLSETMRHLQSHFAPEGGQQLLARFLDGRFRSKLDFLERKRFSALLRQYLVPVPKALAMQVGEQVNDYLWKLMDPCDYVEYAGFAHLLIADEEEQTLIL